MTRTSVSRRACCLVALIAVLASCSEGPAAPKAPAEIAAYEDVEYPNLLFEIPELRMEGVSQVLRLYEDGTATRTSTQRFSRPGERTTTRSIVVHMTYVRVADSLLTEPMPCKGRFCPLISLPAPDYLIVGDGEEILEIDPNVMDVTRSYRRIAGGVPAAD